MLTCVSLRARHIQTHILTPQETTMADIAPAAVAPQVPHLQPLAPAPAPAPTPPAPTTRPSSIPPAPIRTQPVAHGGPTRQYLNQHLTPHLLEGMKYLAMQEPDKPLLWLSEFLRDRSKEVEG